MGNEREPHLRLNIGEQGEVELRPENTSLFTFLGQTAVGDILFDNESADHVFVQLEETEEGARGMYLFERFHPVYSTVAHFVVEHDFPQVLNQRTVPECDMEAYMAHVDAAEKKFHDEFDDISPEDFA